MHVGIDFDGIKNRRLRTPVFCAALSNCVEVTTTGAGVVEGSVFKGDIWDVVEGVMALEDKTVAGAVFVADLNDGGCDDTGTLWCVHAETGVLARDARA